jgi:hypothetical protein
MKLYILLSLAMVLAVLTPVSAMAVQKVQYHVDPGIMGFKGSGEPSTEPGTLIDKKEPTVPVSPSASNNKTSSTPALKKENPRADSLKDVKSHNTPESMMDIIKSEPEVRQQYLEYLKNVLVRENEILNERKRLVNQGLWIGHSMWALASFLVGFCTYLAFREFSAAQQLRKQDAPQELKVSLDGIALKTTLHGVVLLVLAMSFYFLYLKFVYLPGL